MLKKSSGPRPTAAQPEAFFPILLPLMPAGRRHETKAVGDLGYFSNYPNMRGAHKKRGMGRGGRVESEKRNGSSRHMVRWIAVKRRWK